MSRTSLATYVHLMDDSAGDADFLNAIDGDALAAAAAVPRGTLSATVWPLFGPRWMLVCTPATGATLSTSRSFLGGRYWPQGSDLPRRDEGEIPPGSGRDLQDLHQPRRPRGEDRLISWMREPPEFASICTTGDKDCP
jgi:hypothetical protein